VKLCYISSGFVALKTHRVLFKDVAVLPKGEIPVGLNWLILAVFNDDFSFVCFM
jgi:hypothetical protein